MAEKRYKSNRYERCYCSKDVDILVGMKLYRFTNIFILIPICVGFSVLIALGSAGIMTKMLIVTCLILTPILLGWSHYLHAKNRMQKDGHSEECSQKIAYLVMLYAGMWSEFKIMKNKEN